MYPTAPPSLGRFFLRYFDPPSRAYPAGVVTVLATWLPAAGCSSILPISMALPGIPPGGHIASTAFRMTFDDGSTQTYENVENTYQTGTVDNFPTPDGLRCVKVEFVATADGTGGTYDLDGGVVTGYQL